MSERATLSATLRALEIVRDGSAALLEATGSPGAPSITIVNNAIRATLDLALAVKAAANGDPEPARAIARELALHEMRIEL